jgi:hypothetical protein
LHLLWCLQATGEIATHATSPAGHMHRFERQMVSLAPQPPRLRSAEAPGCGCAASGPQLTAWAATAAVAASQVKKKSILKRVLDFLLENFVQFCHSKKHLLALQWQY